MHTCDCVGTSRCACEHACPCPPCARLCVQVRVCNSALAGGRRGPAQHHHLGWCPARGGPEQRQPEPSVRRDCCAAPGHVCRDCCAGNPSAGCHLPVQGSRCSTGPAWLTMEAPHRPRLGASGQQLARAQHGYHRHIPYSRALPSLAWLPGACPL